MSWRNEFPVDFDVPGILSKTLQDVSYGNDICPSFVLSNAEFIDDISPPRIWVNHPDPAKREIQGDKRFIVVNFNDGERTEFETDDVDEAIAKLKEYGV